MMKNLEKSLDGLKENEKTKRKKILNKFRKDLYDIIAKEVDTADFTVVETNKQGNVLRVVGSYPDSRFKSGQHIFMVGKCPKTKSFKLKLYPAGFAGKYSKYGNIPVYGSDMTSANAASLKLVAASLGDSQLFWPEDDEEEPAEKDDEITTVINNYYYTNSNDDDWDDWIWVVPHRPHGPRPPHKPLPPHKPHPKPPKPLPPRPRPVVQEMVKKPLIVKNEGHSGNYGMLPKHVIPGTTGPGKR
jgi:hypothetical protein